MPARIKYDKGQKLHLDSKMTFLEDASPHVSASGKVSRRAFFLCECGNKTNKLISSVVTGQTKSCGCYNLRALSENKTSHGLRSDPLYSVYYGMVRRCTNKKHRSYSLYGGRGISVCDIWLKDISSFTSWGHKNGYKSGLHLDRIDNNQGYSPENCRFVSVKENIKNRSVSKYWYVNGVRYDCAPSAAKANNVSNVAIIRWCQGRKVGDKFYPPKQNCYSELKYPQT